METHYRCTLIHGRVWLWLTLNMSRLRLDDFHGCVNIGTEDSFLRVASDNWTGIQKYRVCV